MNVYCIYLPNGKRYVGVETTTGKRIGDHKMMRSLTREHPQLVDRAIRKYGWGNCHWRYLMTNCSTAEGHALECFFIKLFNLQNRTEGYNITAGGEGAVGMVLSPESRAKISAAKKGKPASHDEGFQAGGEPWNRGIAHSVQTKERISVKLRGQRRSPATEFTPGGEPWNKGKPHSEATKAAIRASKVRLIYLPAGPNGEMRAFRAEQLI